MVEMMKPTGLNAMQYPPIRMMVARPPIRSSPDFLAGSSFSRIARTSRSTDRAHMAKPTTMGKKPLPRSFFIIGLYCRANTIITTLKARKRIDVRMPFFFSVMLNPPKNYG